MRQYALIVFLALLCSSARTATLLVPSQYATIQAAANAAAAGDTVRVSAGTYNEQPTLSTSGNSGAWINYVGSAGAICRGFTVSGSYNRIIGFEIAHVDNSFSGAVVLSGTQSNVEILNNYIHNTRGAGSGEGAAILGATSSYITIRGNTLYYLGFVSGYWTNSNQTGVNSYPVTSHHWLIEYNIIQRSGDFIIAYGTNMVVRNNWLWDFANSYWPGSYGDTMHADIFQPGSDGVQVGTRHQIYERNFCGDDVEASSHGCLFQDSNDYGDTNLMVRGNVFYNFGSGGLGAVRVDKVPAYNNTFYSMNNVTGGGGAAMFIAYGTGGSLNDMFSSTIIDGCNGANAIEVVAPSTCTTERNLGHTAGSHSSFVSTADPQFVSPANPTRNFHLQAASPAVAFGTNVVRITSADGSGTSFEVTDALLLFDGWGMVDGDTITVGSTTTRITSITWPTSVTVADSVTWTNTQPVWWGTDTTPDIGALPYGSADLIWAQINQSGTTYTVTPTGDTRGVWFYTDGIPTSWDSTPPYQATIASGVVTARAYALYAQKNPVVIAQSGEPPPPPPAAGSWNVTGRLRSGTLRIR